MKLIGIGDNVVDRYLGLGMMYPGGNAVNTAVFASRLGASAAYMGVLGNDEAGQLVLRSLQHEGVNTEYITVGEGPNAYAEVALVDRDRVFTGSDRGVSYFELNADQLYAIANYDVAHTAYSGPFAESVAELAAVTRVSYDFGGRFTRESAWPLLPHLHLATFSASELSHEETEVLVADAVSAGATTALATRGGQGAVLGTAAGIWFQPATDVVVRDTLGAGDAFIASVLVGLLSNRGVEQTLASASAHASQVCLEYGAFGHGAALGHASAGRASSTSRAETE